MKRVGDLLAFRKGQPIFGIAPDQTVVSAAQYMAEKNVGAVAVLSGDKVIGIVSERDILTRVVCKKLDPESARVADVMTLDPVKADVTDTCEECAAKMKSFNFRHLPVFDSKRYVGMISLRDLLMGDLQEKNELLERLDDQAWSSPSNLKP